MAGTPSPQSLAPALGDRRRLGWSTGYREKVQVEQSPEYVCEVPGTWRRGAWRMEGVGRGAARSLGQGERGAPGPWGGAQSGPRGIRL